MKISDLTSILEALKSEHGDIEVCLLQDNYAYELDSELIDVVENEKDEHIVAINIDGEEPNLEDETVE
jgi:hypothetical protein